MTKIDDLAFRDCKSLTSVSISASVTKIGEEAFLDCWELAEICYAGTKKQWNAVEKGKNWKKATSIKSITCSDGETK